MTNTDPGQTSPSAGSPPGGCPAREGAAPLYGPRFQQDPAQVYRELRRVHGPVAPVVLEGDVPAWLVLGYRELRHVLTSSQIYGRDSRRWNAWNLVPADWPLLPTVTYQPSVLFAEGAEHQRHAGAISQALAAVDQFELRGQCERIADELIDRFAGVGEVDLVTRYAHPMPVLAVAKMFGLSDADALDLLRNSVAVGAEVIEALMRTRTILQRLLDAKREHPGPDVTSRLLQHPAGFTDDELLQNMIIMTYAAQQPTTDWIGNTLRLMLTDDRFSVSLSGGRRSVGQALNEVLWEDTPTQNHIGRFAIRDTQLGGQRIAAGDLLILGLAAANSDPQVRPDPHAGSDGNQAQMSFSHGEYQCPYPAPEIAEVIAKASVEVLLDRLPDVRLAVPAEELEWKDYIHVRGLTALPVRFTPAYVTGGAG